MQWLNEITPYENMGDCDFLGCTKFELPSCKTRYTCPIDVCGIDFEGCLVDIF